MARIRAGVPAGATLHVSSPAAIAEYLHQHTQHATTQPIPQMRDALAAQNGADATRPVSTATFLRTVAEAGWHAISNGAAIVDIAPFWHRTRFAAGQ